MEMLPDLTRRSRPAPHGSGLLTGLEARDLRKAKQITQEEVAQRNRAPNVQVIATEDLQTII
jgi:hypothetical protein